MATSQALFGKLSFKNGRAVESNFDSYVVAKMKDMPTDDVLFGKGLIRPDGRKIHPNYVLKTKSPAASKGKWDYFEVIATIPAETSFRPIKDGNCPLVN